MSEIPLKAKKIIYLQKYFNNFWCYKENTCKSMSQDLEGQIPLTNRAEQQTPIEIVEVHEEKKQCGLKEVFKNVFCIFIVMIPLITFIYLISFVGTKVVCENIGLTPEQPSHPDLRIVGGKLAIKGEYPHQILIMYKDQPICGASLLKKNVVITSAHCFENSDDPIDYKIVAGEHILSEDEGTEQRRDVQKIVKYPNYDYFQKIYDVALLFLAEDVILNPFVAEIEISKESVPPAGVVATVIGWGVQSEKNNGHPYDKLQEVEVPILSAEECEDIYGDTYPADGSTICAGYPEGRKDACQADSGGPLLIIEESKRTLIGLVSWGIGCGRAGYPGFYANAPFFKDWIQHTINESNEENKGMKIAGFFLGFLAFCLVLVFLGLLGFCIRRRRRFTKANELRTTEPQANLI